MRIRDGILLRLKIKRVYFVNLYFFGDLMNLHNLFYSNKNSRIFILDPWYMNVHYNSLSHRINIRICAGCRFRNRVFSRSNFAGTKWKFAIVGRGRLTLRIVGRLPKEIRTLREFRDPLSHARDVKDRGISSPFLRSDDPRTIHVE